ncbi:MAG: methionyl-tRNA formyltransferase [Oscillospiraceae bacterium]|nr:methionyl-tRNA formyltransferase [Oscillospiraceae bacterium]
MKIVFMGTPDFAVQSLNALLGAGHEIAAVYTRTDKARGRGKKVTFSPMKELALKHDIPVEQPLTFRGDDGEAEVAKLHGYNPDCIIVAAYGMILPVSVLNIPRYGCINVHASLLPQYRGAAPINRCIMEGQAQSGVTIMQMNEGLDTGDMLASESVDIPRDMTASQLHDVLADVGGRLLVGALGRIDSLVPVKQDDSLATYADKITKSECEIDFARSARGICDFIRGLADYPCAWTHYEGVRIKVYKAIAGADESAGVVMHHSHGEAVTLTEVQPEGGKRMNASDFLRGLK